jgi:acyl-[acyl-carrier-protein]-phospholipid O-acyltransferase/long-chain-fatty-acid--[acyl-carrier-protein] ligase
MDTESGELKIRIRKARRKFAAMAATYFSGVLNDNFFRQSAMLIAVTVGLTRLQGFAMVVFTLPFLLFAAPAGFCADRFSKRTIVIASKFLELVAMLFAAVGIYYCWWPMIMVTLFVMGLQSTLFGPALAGTIPELYPAEYVVKANAIIRMASTGAMLAGIATAGFVLAKKQLVGEVPLGRVIAASSVVLVAVAGVILSLGVPKFPAAAPHKSFPWRGPIDTLRTLWQIRSDSLLRITITAKAFFWFVGSLEILVINPLGMNQFGRGSTVASGMVVVQLVGIVIGSLLSPRLAKGKRWHRVLYPAGIVMAVGMVFVAIVPHLPAALRVWTLVAALGVTGAAGGVFSVPLASFVQVRPAADRKGTIIAASSFADFSGILLSGAVFYLLAKVGVLPSNCFAIMAIITASVAVWLRLVLGGKTDNA